MACVSRRGFVGSAAAFAASCAFAAPVAGKRRLDPNLTLLVSDTHVNGGKFGEKHMIAAFERIVADVLKMDPLPARVVSLGDISYSSGAVEDYRRFAELLKPITDAGVVFAASAMGNHDKRSSFAEVFPDLAAKTVVPGWIVSIVDAGAVDLLVLDTLWAKDGPGSAYGVLNYEKENRAQFDYIAGNLENWPKPVFVCAHHPIAEINWNGGTFLVAQMCGSKNVVGFLHGHRHRWSPDWVNRDWCSNAIVRTLGIPSGGVWGDIGYALLKTESGKATVRLVSHGFWFKNSTPESDRQRDLWRVIETDTRDTTCTFPMPQAAIAQS